MKIAAIQFKIPVDLPGDQAQNAASEKKFDIEFLPQVRCFKFVNKKPLLADRVYMVPMENVRGFAPVTQQAMPAAPPSKTGKAAA